MTSTDVESYGIATSSLVMRARPLRWPKVPNEAVAEVKEYALEEDVEDNRVRVFPAGLALVGRDRNRTCERDVDEIELDLEFEYELELKVVVVPDHVECNCRVCCSLAP